MTTTVVFFGCLLAKTPIANSGFFCPRTLPRAIPFHYTLTHMTFTTRRISEEKPQRVPGLIKAAPFLARLSGAVFGWYGRWKQRKEEEKQAHVLKRILLVLLTILLGLVLLAGTVKALVALRILTPHSFLSVAGADLPVDAHGYTNFLLLGSGDKSHEGVDLTDSMMIASFDPKKTKSVVLLSIPRDLYISSKLMGKGRINSLYRDYKGYLRAQGKTKEEAAKEALVELGNEVSRLFHVQIHHIVKVDFIAFVKVVDTLGGIDVIVPEDIVDSQYPGPNYSYETFVIHAGPQHLDGETALKYARSRHSTSDFDRSARQQLILKAIAEKAGEAGLATSPGKITSFLQILSENVLTTMSFQEILGAGKIADRMERGNVISVHLNNQTGYSTFQPAPGGLLYNPPLALFAGASVLLPVSIPEGSGNWRQIQTLTALLLNSRSILLAQPQIYVYNAGAPSGAASRLAAELTRFGFRVEQSGNLVEDRDDPAGERETSVVIGKLPEDESLAEFFGGLLQIPATTPPADILPDLLGQVTIVLGKDYTYTPLQDLVPVDDQWKDMDALSVPEPDAPAGSGALSSTGTGSTAPSWLSGSGTQASFPIIDSPTASGSSDDEYYRL